MINGNNKTFNTVAYRGINEKNALKFEEEGYLSYSKGNDEYFGHGIYFFEDDDREAFNFAKYVRKFSEIYIIKSQIVVEEIYILDFLKSKVYDEYTRFLEEYVIDKTEEIEEKFKKNEKFDCALINFLCNTENFKLVRGAYNPQSRRGSELIEKKFTRIRKTHIQLCVRDINIIVSSQITEHDFV